MSATQTVKKNYALPIAMMYLLFFMIAFVTNLCNPMAVIVKNQFEVSNAMAQLGNAANFIAYAVMGIPAGILLKRIGYKKTAMTAIAVGFLGVFLQYVSGWNAVQSYGVYLSGAFIAGFCMCMLNTVVNPMLNTLGGGGKRGNQLIQFLCDHLCRSPRRRCFEGPDLGCYSGSVHSPRHIPAGVHRAGFREDSRA